MIKDILKSSVLKDSLNESQIVDIENAFNEAVDLKASQIANDIITEKELELKETLEIKTQELEEQFETHTNAYEEHLVEKVDEFITRELEKFLDESKDLLEAEAANAKSKAILSIFDSLIETAGIEVSSLVESGKSAAEFNYDRLAEKYDAAILEKSALKEELTELRNKVLISEATEGMNLMEAEKFKKIASLLLEEEEDEEKAKEKVDNLKKSVKKSQETDEDSEDSEDDDKEDVKESFRNARNTRKVSSIDWSRF